VESVRLIGEQQKTICPALKLHGNKALDSMVTELRALDKKVTFMPVDVNSLSKTEVKKMIRSFMFISEKKDPSGNMIKSGTRRTLSIHVS
jgi:protein tyrosine phosphatase (PTP) superfamily phosphohydrolase (DUF442 family)